MKVFVTAMMLASLHFITMIRIYIKAKPLGWHSATQVLTWRCELEELGKGILIVHQAPNTSVSLHC